MNNGMPQRVLSAAAKKFVAQFEESSQKRMADGNAAGGPTEPLYHYTSENALYAIIGSQTFWFSSIYTMDDKS
jgi:hypothetical protein